VPENIKRNAVLDLVGRAPAGIVVVWYRQGLIMIYPCRD